MPGVVRLSDLCSGHDCFCRRCSCSSSEDTYTNNIKTTRFQDVRPVHSCTHGSHGGTNVGVHNVLVNNRYIQAGGDPVDCGSIQDQCSHNVIVN